MIIDAFGAGIRSTDQCIWKVLVKIQISSGFCLDIYQPQPIPASLELCTIYLNSCIFFGCSSVVILHELSRQWVESLFVQINI